MRLDVGAVDHDRLAVRSRPRQLIEDTREDPHARPADELVVKRLVRAVDRRRVAPAKAIALDENDPAQNLAVIHPRLATRPREMRFQKLHLFVG